MDNKSSSQLAAGNFSATLVSQIVSLLVSLLLVRIYTQELSLQDFGLYSLIILIPEFLSPLLFWEVTAGFSRFYHQFKKQGLYFSVLVLLIFIFALFSGLFVIAQPLWPLLKSYITSLETVSSHHLYLAFCLSFLVYLHGLNLAKFKLDYEYKKIFTSSLLINISKLLLVILFVNSMEDKILAILAGLSLAHLVVFVPFALLILKEQGCRLEMTAIRKSIHFSRWFVPAAYFGVVINFMDRFLIAHFIGLAEVGIYSLAYKIGDLVKQFFVSAFNSVLTPLKFSSENTSQNFQSKMNRLFTIYCFAGLFVTLLINSCSVYLIQFLGGSTYMSAVLVVPYILSAHIIFGAMGFFNTGYLVTDKSQYGLVSLAVGAAANFILNLILIPQWASVGAALATLVSFAVTLPVAYFYSKQHHSLRFELQDKRLLLLSFVTVLFAQIQMGSLGLELWLSTLLSIILSLLFVALSYIWLKSEDRQFLKEQWSLIRAKFQ